MKNDKLKKYKKPWLEHNSFLKRLGLPQESFELFVKKQTGKYKPKLRGVKVVETYHKRKSPDIPSGDTYSNTKATKKEAQTYTGEKLLGIATMHKSNMVPVFSKEDAEDISKMRRN